MFVDTHWNARILKNGPAKKKLPACNFGYNFGDLRSLSGIVFGVLYVEGGHRTFLLPTTDTSASAPRGRVEPLRGLPVDPALPPAARGGKHSYQFPPLSYIL